MESSVPPTDPADIAASARAVPPHRYPVTELLLRYLQTTLPDGESLQRIRRAARPRARDYDDLWDYLGDFA